MTGAGEAVRLIVQAANTEAREAGWYLLAVTAIVATGVLAPRHTDEVPETNQVDAASRPAPESPPPTSQASEVVDAGRFVREAIIFFVIATIYAWALPWIGFALTNGLFVAAFLVFIDHRRWWLAVVLAVLIDICLIVGMDLLNVLLPTGVLGLNI